MNIREAMEQATAEMLKEKSLTSAREINNHDCFNWAFKVFNLVPGSAIGGQRILGEGQSYIIYRGVCYDSETPEGVINWFELTTFKRMIANE